MQPIQTYTHSPLTGVRRNMEATVINSHKNDSFGFSRDLLHGSILDACYAVETLEGEAELIAHHVCEKVEQWLEQRAHVTSDDIRRIAGQHLEVLHPAAGYLYINHHTIV